jgi:hypothetical protein
MSELSKLQVEFEAAKPGYGFAKHSNGSYMYEGVQAMLNDWLENNELRQAKLRIPKLEAQLAAVQKDATRLDWLESRLTGASDSERYLPFRVYWGITRNIRATVDKAKGEDT